MDQHIWINNHKDKSFAWNEWISTYEQINIKKKALLKLMNQHIWINKHKDKSFTQNEIINT